jgi:hypothetical protein
MSNHSFIFMWSSRNCAHICNMQLDYSPSKFVYSSLLDFNSTPSLCAGSRKRWKAIIVFRLPLDLYLVFAVASSCGARSKRLGLYYRLNKHNVP